VQDLVRQFGRNPSGEQTLEIAERRQKLSKRLDAHEADVDLYLRTAGGGLHPIRPEDVYNPRNYWDSLNDGEEQQELPSPSTVIGADTFVEHLRPTLPSTYGFQECCRLGLRAHAEVELRLRTGQADDLLKLLRDRIGERSCLYATEIRHGQGNYTQTTRSWTTVHRVTNSLKTLARRYDVVWEAIMSLNPSEQQQRRYQKLYREDTRNIGELFDPRSDPNARSQRHESLPWIWTTVIPPGPDEPTRKAEYALSSKSVIIYRRESSAYFPQ
jgi:hypothetical protein